MKTFLVGDCALDRLYQMTDPDAPNENEFEFSVGRALSCVYGDRYRCIVFGGTFLYDDRCYRPDLALIAKDLSHWFVIEVELVSHSFAGHVLPQVKAFHYGTPQPDCAAVLCRELRFSQQQALTFLAYTPRAAAVIANKRDQSWESRLDAHGIQLLAVSVFRSSAGVEAIEIDGRLEVLKESVGIGQYSATDRSLRFPRSISLTLGTIQVNDPGSTAALWVVARDNQFTWLTRERGTPDMQDGCFIQLIRAVDGQLSFRRPREPHQNR